MSLIKKITMITSIVLTATASISMAKISAKEETSIINKTMEKIIKDSKSIRSTVYELAKSEVPGILSDNSTFEEPISNEDLTYIAICKESKSCKIYLGQTDSESQGGTGSYYHWILLNTDNGDIYVVSHLVATE